MCSFKEEIAIQTIAKQLIAKTIMRSHTFFVKFPSFKTTSRKEYSAIGLIFSDDVYFAKHFNIRSFVFVADLERRVHVYANEANIRLLSVGKM